VDAPTTPRKGPCGVWPSDENHGSSPGPNAGPTARPSCRSGSTATLSPPCIPYGGLVFRDVTTVRFPAKAADAAVDGLIAVTYGAGGHAGLISPFAALHEIRQIFDGTLLVGGAPDGCGLGLYEHLLHGDGRGGRATETDAT
jgi:hypothetical protein